MKFIKKYSSYSPALLRIGLSFVFIWFGINQLFNQSMFIGYLPEWAMGHPVDSPHHHVMEIVHNIPNRTAVLLTLNGLFEIVFGVLLFIGLFTRLSSLLLAFHLLGITISLGYNDVAVRDFGLVLATFSIFLHGYDDWSLDRNMRYKLSGKMFRWLYFFDNS